MNQVFSRMMPVARAGVPVTITPMQTLDPKDSQAQDSSLLELTGPDTIHVQIDGPQASLTADLIAGVYPAPGSETSPDEFLPHIAFNRRTLPWERQGPQPDREVPWLALLVFSEADFATVTPSVRGGPFRGQPQQAPTVSVDKFAVVDTPEPTRNHLVNTLGIPGDAQVSTLTVPNSVLRKVMPKVDELPLLCHVKRSVVAGVETDHAIVVANRLPNAAAPEGERAPLHLAVLVSVERWAQLFPVGPQPPVITGTTTLLVLHHWTFRPYAGGDFEQVVKAIRYRPNGGVLRFGNLPADVAEGEDAPLSGDFQSLLNPSGTFITPLEHDQDVGAATYRGPLRPFGPQPRSSAFAIAAAPSEFADAPQGAPLEYSHAAAFELGRLLALADPAILEDLRDIRATAKQPVEPPDLVNQLPDALQKPDWVQNPQWVDEPWQDFGGQSLVKDQTQFLARGVADPSGLADHLDKWNLGDIVSTVTGIGAVVSAPVTAVNIGSITADQLAVEFADVAEAAQE
ncbi:hypothetical protein [Mycolicibacterium holsaticum]|uniref:hypothetical protein n=1 Tax=Mycolicibacterium holsaticum TaxID=152142 RepID=UPI001C7CBA7E|nr:hypothetical protein [Mycolicibacterium holsaticum]MDA4107834.1 hypothetical protein [Mycolicibacterium holsaticum DSM 44478 = JCM 12374]QZA14723.1 hypothetical protein K3U96_11850 [Mycolicibacterium holsaticum DSM 44478 = JCM 12374]UNC07834.1 hypothetical protein H5U41_14985 [Mycolicibacterium holsaticum DSM 44478 = JCM 12374]